MMIFAAPIADIAIRRLRTRGPSCGLSRDERSNTADGIVLEKPSGASYLIKMFDTSISTVHTVGTVLYLSVTLRYQ